MILFDLLDVDLIDPSDNRSCSFYKKLDPPKGQTERVSFQNLISFLYTKQKIFFESNTKIAKIKELVDKFYPSKILTLDTWGLSPKPSFLQQSAYVDLIVDDHRCWLAKRKKI